MFVLEEVSSLGDLHFVNQEQPTKPMMGEK